MTLREILCVKGRLVHTIAPHATLAEAARKLVDANCGSLVVCDGEQMVGILTERDLLRAAALLDDMLETLLVDEFMTRQVIVACPDDEIEVVMGLMTNHRVRHLPVIENGQLTGIVSIGDLVKAHHDRVCLENEYLKHYIYS